VYFSINGDQAKASSNAYSIEQAEHGLIIFKYWYQVITQYDSCFVPLFFSADGEIEDYIVIDEWKLYFDKPKTSDFRCYGINVYMQKDNLKVSLAFNRSNVEEDFPKIWKLFKIVRNCKSQIELDYVVKI
jgi:hypothetical protein